MKLHVLCIGDELLIGHTVNSNLAHLGACLLGTGHRIAEERCIPDTFDGIRQAIRDASGTADVVITVGGLGPTSDDVTRDAVAAALGRPLEFQAGAYDHIRAWLGERSVRVPDRAVRMQASVPSGGEAVLNTNGTAPGLWVDTGQVLVICLPGPPRELRPMMETSILPRLVGRFPPATASRTIPTAGIPESQLAERLEAELRKRYPDIQPGYCARPHCVDVRLTAAAERASELSEAEAFVREHLAEGVLPAGCGTLAEAVGHLLTERRWTVATAESCTGGGIAERLTSVAGASAYFAGSVVAYSNAWKTRLLAVPQATLQSHGAVSGETAEAMLVGLRDRTGADAGISVTGIAGPGGGSETKPVGLVFIGTNVGDDRRVSRHVFPGNRDAIRRRTVIVALNQLRRHLLEFPAQPCAPASARAPDRTNERPACGLDGSG